MYWCVVHCSYVVYKHWGLVLVASCCVLTIAPSGCLHGAAGPQTEQTHQHPGVVIQAVEHTSQQHCYLSSTEGLYPWTNMVIQVLKLITCNNNDFADCHNGQLSCILASHIFHSMYMEISSHLQCLRSQIEHSLLWKILASLYIRKYICS